MEEVFLTDFEAATVLKINVRHVRRMFKAGVLRGKDISLGTGKRKMLRILMADVIGYKKSTK
jgi:hypothetical protein